MSLILLDKSKYDKDALSYFNRASISNSTERDAVNVLFKTWKANGNIWRAVKNGAVYLVSPTSYGASLYNAVSSNFTITTGAAPAYSTNGWQFDGATTYLRTGFIPATSMTINQGFIFAYNRSTNGQSDTIPFGAADASNNQWNIIIRTTTDLFRLRAFDGATQTAIASTNSNGRFFAGITASNSRYVLRNGTLLASDSATVGGSLVNLECYIGARNLSGAANSFSNMEIATMISGTAALGQTDATALDNSISIYNNTVISGGR